MRKYKNIIIICVLVIIVGVVFYFTGYKAAQSKMDGTQGDYEQQTFYATITSIRDLNFSVTGLSVNDINFRGDFEFAVTDDTKLEWRGTELSASDFEIGDNISITFSGAIQETEPATILEVIRVQLLDDEK